MIVIFHPAHGYERLKKKLPYLQAAILYLLVCVVAVLKACFTHWPLSAVKPENANIFLEMGKLMVPVFTFILVSYGMFTLHNGEAKLKHVFVSTAFSMLPYVMLTPPLILISHLLSRTDGGLYYALTAVVWIWVLYHIYRQVNTLNNYTFPQTMALIGLTVLGMLALWALLVLLYFLSRNLFLFIRQVWIELYLYGKN